MQSLAADNPLDEADPLASETGAFCIAVLSFQQRELRSKQCSHFPSFLLILTCSEHFVLGVVFKLFVSITTQ